MPGGRIVLIAGAAILMAAAPCCRHAPGPAEPAPIVFGRLPSLTGEAGEAEVRPMLRYLERAVGRRVILLAPPTYRETERALAERRMDVAYLGGVGFSRSEPYGYEAVAMFQRHGSRMQRGLIFTREDSGLRSLADLKGKRVAFVDDGSSTGWHFPIAALFAAGVRPEHLRREFLHGHDKVVLAVLVDRTFDAGACYEAAIEAVLQDRPEVARKARILARTEEVTHGVLAVRKDHPLAGALAKAILAVNEQPDAKQILSPFQADALVVPGPNDFDAARRVDLLINELTGE